MRLTRALLACLLSLTVVVQGHVAAGVMNGACGLHHHGSPAGYAYSSAHAADAHAHDLQAPHDMAGGHHTSQVRPDADSDDPALCSCLAGCHAVSSLPVSLTLQVQGTKLSLPAPAWTEQQFRSLSLPARWRPPAAI